MPKLPLTIALGDYEHTRDLVSEAVLVKGVDPTYLVLSIEETTNRFMRFGEFDVCELSFGNYCSLLSRADPPAVAIPVFTSRVFRHSAFYVRQDSRLTTLRELSGLRIGIPQWSQTGTIYARGLLADHNVDLSGISWVQAGLHEPDRQETASISLPAGISIEPIADQSLTEMLLKSQIDVIISARPPRSEAIRHLLSDVRRLEEEYWMRTEVFPIMHLIVMKRDTYAKNRWIARSLLDAFEDAKRRSVARFADPGTSYAPVAWASHYVKSVNEQIFPHHEPWPYGLDANRATIEAFMSYCHAQGVLQQALSPEELFAPESLMSIRV